MEGMMKVSKWGNSLAIRLSTEVVEKLGVKEGDELTFSPDYQSDALRLQRKKTLEEMWKRVDEIRDQFKVPADYKFDREEANSRGND
jgi:antitoxin MazE